MAEYIEREAFLADKKWLYCTDCDKRKGKKRGKIVTLYEIGEAQCKSCGIHDMIEEVEAYPSADVAPVRHGRWDDFKPDMPLQRKICSECGYITNPWLAQVYNFCPICGAKMDGGE